MYRTSSSLTPALSPDAYRSAAHWELEREHVFQKSWHLVGTLAELPHTGDFITADLLGISVLVRNFGDQLVCFRNVCAHRQCQLSSAPRGHAETLRCPYHGWEYGADGRTRKIPMAKNFPHFRRDDYTLDSFCVETCGSLVFVRLSNEGPSLKEWMGSRSDLFATWFDLPDFSLVDDLQFAYPSNWKVPVEITLESYHIPYVHPESFSEDPGEDRSEHHFYNEGTSISTHLLTPTRADVWMKAIEKRTLSFLGVPFTNEYEHHHVFPNLMISRTDCTAVVQHVSPCTETTSAGKAWVFRRNSARDGAVRRWVSRRLGRQAFRITTQIMNEDIAMYALVQAGVNSDPRTGILGRCEERIHSFQSYIADQIRTGTTADA